MSRWLVVAVLAAFVVGGIWYLRNFVDHGSPLWPFVLASLMFLYLWWLAILTFDLSFIWHRYIRNSVALDTLRDWREKKDTKPRTFRPRKPKDC